MAKLDAATGAAPGTTPLCAVSAEITGMAGAGIMLMSGDVARGSFCTSDDVSNLVEELQFTLGEGPCVDAYHLDRPVLEPDLADPAERRWVAFTPPALEAGVRAIFGFPLQVGSVRLGALNLYRARPGPLTDEQHADCLVVADVAARAVLDLQAEAAGVAPEEDLLGVNLQLVVHQAAGMGSVQLGVSVAEALVRLRAFAFSQDRLLADVAGDVVSRTLRLE